MSHTTIEEMSIYNCVNLIGNFYAKDTKNIRRICENIPNINCKIMFQYTTFGIKIVKNDKKFKMTIFARGLSKELVYFLSDLPNDIDSLVLDAFVLNEKLTNLPQTLKKICFVSSDKPTYNLLHKLKNCKIPNNTKIFYEAKNCSKYELDSFGKIRSQS